MYPRTHEVPCQAAGVKTVADNWGSILAGLRQLDDTVVEVGWFDQDAATIAYINDRGSADGKHPPPRPVLTPGGEAVREDVQRAWARTVRNVMHGGGSGAVASGAQRVAEIVEQGVRDAIDGVQPPNAPETIGNKHGYTAPLRGFSPDRIWNKLTTRITSPSDETVDDG